LAPDPFDQLVELDGLFGRSQRVGCRKSVLDAGLSRAAGGNGQAKEKADRGSSPG
jgi:hypothetical protein